MAPAPAAPAHGRGDELRGAAAGGLRRLLVVAGMNGRRGLVFVISGPSGVGKDALIDRLLARDPNLRRSVSFTTRHPRSNENDGVDYSFVPRDKFHRLVPGPHMLENARYDGTLHGTSQKRVNHLP